jgi:lipopolysaccharide export system permease protein
MKVLDHFIIKKFLVTFLMMIGAFVIIAVVFDLSENVDDFVRNKAPLNEVLINYYFNFCLFFGNLLSAFIIFLTVIWFTSKMAQQSEVIAMLSSGISYSRILRPYILVSGGLTIISLLLGHWIIPLATKFKYNFEIKYIKTNINIVDMNVHREVFPGLIAHFYRINGSNKSGTQFSLENWNHGRLSSKILATHAEYNDTLNKWHLDRVQIRKWNEKGQESVQFKNQIDTIIPVKMDDFVFRTELLSALSTPELLEFMDKQEKAGSGRAAEANVEFHNRTASAFSIIILTIIGVTIASKKVRGGTGVHLLFAVVIGFVYIFISRVAAVAAMKIGVPVLLAVWLPNILFAFVGFRLYKSAQS